MSSLRNNARKEIVGWSLVLAVCLLALVIFLLTTLGNAHQRSIDQIKARGHDTLAHLQYIAPRLSQEPLQSYVQKIYRQTGIFSYILIMNREGLALVHSNPQRQGMVFFEGGLKQVIDSGSSLEQIYLRDADNPSSPYHGEKTVDFLAPYFDIHGRIIGAVNVGIPLQRLEQVHRHYLKTTLFGVLICVLSILGTGLMAYRNLAKQTELIRASEENQRILLDNIPTQVWFLTDAETYGAVNRAHAAFYGADNAAMACGKLRDFRPDAATAVQQNKVVFETGKPLRGEQWLTLPDGTEHFIVTQKTPIFDAKGQVEYVVCAAEDMTSRKRAEKALEDERDYINTLINKIPTVIVGIAPNGQCRFINPAGEKLTGYGRHELLNKNWWQTFYPEDGDHQVETLLKQVGQVDLLDHEMTLTTRSRGQRTLSWSSFNRLDENGQLLEQIGFGFDITERKQQAEELLRLQSYLTNIINSIPSVLIGVDAFGAVTQWNKAAEAATGIAAEDAKGKIIFQLLPEFAADIQNIKKSIYSRQIWRDLKRQRDAEDGTRYEDFAIYPLVNKEVEGAVIRIDDVTDKIRLDEIMVQSEKMLSLGGLAAGMAHEINNPLAGIVQSANLLLTRLTDKELAANQRTAAELGTSMETIHAFMVARNVPNLAGTILETGQRIAEIVENMLSFARTGSGVKKLCEPVVLVEQTLELVAADYNLSAGYDFRSIEIQREYQDKLPLIPCEKAKIQQVLLNIFANGAQAMHKDQRGQKTARSRFIIRLAKEAGTNMLRVEIEDNGPGIDDAIRKRIFEPFFTTKPEGMGTGLGLSVSYFIITENHGGTIEVDSEPGCGTCFTIRLPLSAPQD